MSAAVRAMAVSSQVATWRPSCTGSGRHVCGAAAVTAGGHVASSAMAASGLEPSSVAVVCSTSMVGGGRRSGEAARDVRQARGGNECGCSCAPAPRFASSTTARAAVRGLETSLGRHRCAGFDVLDRHRRRASPSNPRRRTSLVVCMGIRAVESFDATFELIPESKEILSTLLSSDIFCNQEFEKYHEDKENYVIVNVPPNYMFQAKIFKPSRLCAIFQRVGSKLRDVAEPATDGQQQEQA
ncbi:hypothetical protein CBR_g656 [Chara braunii]|uniref:Uncharacterized protein n=1 Tax=Chara braunii TaxID=69332 RepID=A0A388KBZ9_CHABU|nr:hypothetical protein CBR_g656 [Chara braunii]|eukprot:GBG67526.1 hypothetical protein CBR_g656 [Chara braunii]